MSKWPADNLWRIRAELLALQVAQRLCTFTLTIGNVCNMGTASPVLLYIHTYIPRLGLTRGSFAASFLLHPRNGFFFYKGTWRGLGGLGQSSPLQAPNPRKDSLVCRHDIVKQFKDRPDDVLAFEDHWGLRMRHLLVMHAWAQKVCVTSVCAIYDHRPRRFL